MSAMRPTLTLAGIAMACACSSFGAACGQTGALYLPDEQPAAKVPAQSAPATPPDGPQPQETTPRSRRDPARNSEQR